MPDRAICKPKGARRPNMDPNPFNWLRSCWTGFGSWFCWISFLLHAKTEISSSFYLLKRAPGLKSFLRPALTPRRNNLFPILAHAGVRVATLRKKADDVFVVFGQQFSTLHQQFAEHLEFRSSSLLPATVLWKCVVDLDVTLMFHQSPKVAPPFAAAALPHRCAISAMPLTRCRGLKQHSSSSVHLVFSPAADREQRLDSSKEAYWNSNPFLLGIALAGECNFPSA